MRLKKISLPVCLGILFVFSACKRMSKDEKFKQELEQYTQKECPRQTDPYTRMDSVCYDIKSRTRSEYYMVMNELDNDSIFADERLMEGFREDLLKELKSSIQLKQYKDEGITFRYIYRSLSSSKTKLELTFTPEDYN